MLFAFRNKAVSRRSKRWNPHEHRTYAASGPNPFAASPLTRHAWAFERLGGVAGLHLDIGTNRGAFAGALAAATGRVCVGVDVEIEDLQVTRYAWPRVLPVLADGSAGLPFADASFATASLLDVIEHVADDGAVLEEALRVVRPGGLIVVTVPARHVFSFLDPDDWAFRFPRAHKFAWSLRYGSSAYGDRFGDPRAPRRGDIAVERGGHTNYEPDDLTALLERAGFVVDEMEGSGLWFRWLQIPALVLPGRIGSAFDRALVADAARFRGAPGTGLARRANLFVVARRPAVVAGEPRLRVD